MRFLAATYTAAWVAAGTWAWCVHVLFDGATEERLLPGMIFFYLSLPASFLMGPVEILFEPILPNPMLLLTALGWLQVAAVWWIVSRWR